MKHALAPNLEIGRNARRILVSKWIDLGRLSLHTTKNSILIRGMLQKLPGADAQITAEYVETIYRKLQDIPGVHNVNLQFDNWIRNNATGSWINAETAKTTVQTRLREKDASSGIYELR